MPTAARRVSNGSGDSEILPDQRARRSDAPRRICDFIHRSRDAEASCRTCRLAITEEEQTLRYGLRTTEIGRFRAQSCCARSGCDSARNSRLSAIRRAVERITADYRWIFPGANYATLAGRDEHWAYVHLARSARDDWRHAFVADKSADTTAFRARQGSELCLSALAFG